MGKKQLSTLFFIKRTKLLKNGEAPIAIRITYGGEYAESQVGRSVLVKLWSQSKSHSLGRDRAATELNSYLDMIRVKIHNIHQELERSGEYYTATTIRDIYIGKGVEVKTLCSIFRDHNDQCRKLIGIDYDAVTVGRYDKCLEYLVECIKSQYKKEDLNLNEITPELIRNFECYIKAEKGCAHNTAIRYLKRFKKITSFAMANGWIMKNPFLGIKLRDTPVNKEFLTMDEINIIANKEMKIERLGIVRDVFLFCCFTGLAFTDVFNLRKEHITTDSKGKLWIYKAREKTSNMCNIPLLATPQQILEKYKDHPVCLANDVLLPVISNQRMNSYLKEIADVCGIVKNLTTHLARHCKTYYLLSIS